MAILFPQMVNEALDEVAPVKTFTVKENYIKGLTDETKLLMSKRDKARSALTKTKGEKWIALKKYKSLRNRVTQQIRQDVKNANGKKIDEANNETEYWKVVNDIIKPNRNPTWKLVEDGLEVNSEKDIAETLNTFFVSKIENLKANIFCNLSAAKVAR